MANNKKKDFLKSYVTSKNELMTHFKCDEDFFIKPMEGIKWAVKTEEDFSFLFYWTSEEKKQTAVIVKKNGEPMIYKTNDYTMVIAIDCVKIAFVFSNKNIYEGE